MRVLIIGSSGVEHAIANKLAADNSAEMIFVTLQKQRSKTVLLTNSEQITS